MREKIVKVLLFLASLSILLALLLAGSLLQGGIFGVFGFRYDGLWDFVKFLLLIALMTLPLEIGVTTLVQGWMERKNLTLVQARGLFMLIYSLGTLIFMFLVVQWIEGLDVSMLSLVLCAIWLSLSSMDQIKPLAEQI